MAGQPVGPGRASPGGGLTGFRRSARSPITIVLAVATLTAVGVFPALALPAPAVAPSSVAAAMAATPSASVQAAVDSSVDQAATDGIQQSVAVVDRNSGAVLAVRNGDSPYICESIVKLFTVAYYDTQADGHPDPELADRLRTMIIYSDDRIESSLWNTAIVPAMAARYALGHTANGARTGPHDWGWETITASDEAKFLYEMSHDAEVAPSLLPAMADVAPSGADGFDQGFGLNALTGDHGSKQGWTDIGSADRVQIHSVGWTGPYFVAILQTSTSASYDAMRSAATRTARAVQTAGADPSPGGAAPDPRTTTNDADLRATALAIDAEIRAGVLARTTLADLF